MCFVTTEIQYLNSNYVDFKRAKNIKLQYNSSDNSNIKINPV